MTAEPGSIVGLIGPNGSGKTTILDAISGLVTPRSGTIRVDGESLGDYLPEERIQVGTVRSFQDCQLFPELTVEDTLLLCEDARRSVGVLSTTLQMPWARRSERAKRHAVDTVIASFGLERFRHHRTAHLSTGTRRVVDLASVVLAEPRLLLLDEPTAGIAQREAEAFIPLLRRLHEVADTTIVLVEHDVPLVFELCSKVVVMETGRVVASGTPDEVSRDPGRWPRTSARARTPCWCRARLQVPRAPRRRVGWSRIDESGSRGGAVMNTALQRLGETATRWNPVRAVHRSWRRFARRPRSMQVRTILVAVAVITGLVVYLAGAPDGSSTPNFGGLGFGGVGTGAPSVDLGGGRTARLASDVVAAPGATGEAGSAVVPQAGSGGRARRSTRRARAPAASPRRASTSSSRS